MRVRAWVGFGVALAGAALLVVLGWTRSDRVFGLGLALGVVAAAALSHALLARPAADAYEAGHAAGYDKGWTEGRRTARPVLVEFPDADEQAS
jgi:hypothetical protein